MRNFHKSEGLILTCKNSTSNHSLINYQSKGLKNQKSKVKKNYRTLLNKSSHHDESYANYLASKIYELQMSKFYGRLETVYKYILS